MTLLDYRFARFHFRSMTMLIDFRLFSVPARGKTYASSRRNDRRHTMFCYHDAYTRDDDISRALFTASANGHTYIYCYESPLAQRAAQNVTSHAWRTNALGFNA